MLDTLRAAWAAGQLRETETRQGLVQLVETMAGETTEPIGSDFASFVNRGYHDNGIVFACITARLILFAQARFVLERITDQQRRTPPPRLAILEEPWPNGSTSELLARIEQDTSLAGNYYLYKAAPNRLQRLRPDWVDIVLDGREVIGYLYHPAGRGSGKTPVALRLDEVAHGAPYPDPLRAFRGSSWISAVTREVMADSAMTRHKLKFFDNAATPNLLITVDTTLSDPQRDHWRSQLDAKFGGWRNAYKTMVLEEGADARVIGSNMREIDFTTTQSAGENRVAVAAGVPSVVLGIKEGAEQATYSNYSSAIQHFAAFTIRHLWLTAAKTLEQVVNVPAGWRLMYDDSGIPALQTDLKDEAEIQEIQATTMRELIDTGFTPESVVEAVTTGDMGVLVHTGLISDELALEPETTPALPEGERAGSLAFLRPN